MAIAVQPRIDAVPPPARNAGRLDRRVFRIASAHLIVDAYTNVYAPLLPLLIPKLKLSLFAAGALAMIFQMAASVAQLGFGRLADRWHPQVLLVAGPLVTVLALSFIGTAASVVWLIAVLVIGGLGAAAFHPPGAMLTHRLGTTRPGLAMSVFVGGGTTGFALSPFLFSTVTERHGLGATPWLMLPGLIGLAIVFWKVPPLPLERRDERSGWRALRPYARPLTLLYVIVVLRTLAGLAFGTFVPVMLTRRGLSIAQAGAIVAVYLLASSAGGFVGGPLSDRWGPRRIIMVSLLLSMPFLMAAPALTGTAFCIVLAIGGFFLQSTQPVSVAFGQTIAPVSAATVSSLMMGVAWGTGGMLIPLIGLSADRVGVETTLAAIAAAPLLGSVLAMWLPGGIGPHVEPRPAEVGISEPV
jgi:MFS transporter, FSR family, fosmidomycin resistance protein